MSEGFGPAASRGGLESRGSFGEIYEPDFVGHHPGQLDWTGPEKVKDWLVERRDGTRVLDVRLTLRTDDRQLIYAHYPGLFHGPPDEAGQLHRVRHCVKRKGQRRCST